MNTLPNQPVQGVRMPTWLRATLITIAVGAVAFMIVAGALLAMFVLAGGSGGF